MPLVSGGSLWERAVRLTTSASSTPSAPLRRSECAYVSKALLKNMVFAEEVSSFSYFCGVFFQANLLQQS